MTNEFPYFPPLPGTEKGIATTKSAGVDESEMNMADPAETALAMLKATTLRERELYHPFQALQMTTLYKLFPRYMELVFINMIEYE